MEEFVNGEQIKVPPKIGAYVFRGTIGDGAFSVVKLTYQEETKSYYACKIVPRSRISHSNLEERFEGEIRINQQLHHPGVVQIVDLMSDEFNYYIIMEFCPNGELFQYIVDQQRVKESEAAILLSQILLALRYVHQNGIAHRDLKPENLLLDSRNRLKISDFGLSRYIGRNGLVETPCGSPCYASPECLSGEAYDGRTSDVWSCGVILYAMLTGQLPWTKRNQNQLFDQIRSGDYKTPSYLSDNCRNLINGLMNVDPKKRMTIDQALSHPFMIKSAQMKYDYLPLTIVSLKHVDEFFNRDRPEEDKDIIVDDNPGRSFSIGLYNFAQAVKEIFDPNKLPPIKQAHKVEDFKAKTFNKTEVVNFANKRNTISRNQKRSVQTSMGSMPLQRKKSTGGNRISATQSVKSAQISQLIRPLNRK